MTDEVTKTGSQRLIEESTNNGMSAAGLEILHRWLDATPTYRDLYDAIYAQGEVNVRISQALVSGYGGDKDRLGYAIQDLLDRLQLQASQLGDFAQRGIMRAVEAGIESKNEQ